MKKTNDIDAKFEEELNSVESEVVIGGSKVSEESDPFEIELMGGGCKTSGGCRPTPCTSNCGCYEDDQPCAPDYK